MGNRGVTLLELLMVIAIMAIMAGFATVGVDMIRREEVRSATRQLLTDLRTVRLNAVLKEGRGYGVRFESSSSYVVFAFDDCNNDFNYDRSSCAGGSPEESNAEQKEFAPSIQISKSGASSDITEKVIYFDRLGASKQESGGLGLLTVLVRHQQVAAYTKCIVISSSRIRDGSWDGSQCI